MRIASAAVALGWLCGFSAVDSQLAPEELFGTVEETGFPMWSELSPEELVKAARAAGLVTWKFPCSHQMVDEGKVFDSAEAPVLVTFHEIWTGILRHLFLIHVRFNHSDIHTSSKAWIDVSNGFAPSLMDKVIKFSKDVRRFGGTWNLRKVIPNSDALEMVFDSATLPRRFASDPDEHCETRMLVFGRLRVDDGSRRRRKSQNRFGNTPLEPMYFGSSETLLEELERRFKVAYDTQVEGPADVLTLKNGITKMVLIVPPETALANRQHWRRMRPNGRSGKSWDASSSKVENVDSRRRKSPTPQGGYSECTVS